MKVQFMRMYFSRRWRWRIVSNDDKTLATGKVRKGRIAAVHTVEAVTGTYMRDKQTLVSYNGHYEIPVEWLS